MSWPNSRVSGDGGASYPPESRMNYLSLSLANTHTYRHTHTTAQWRQCTVLAHRASLRNQQAAEYPLLIAFLAVLSSIAHSEWSGRCESGASLFHGETHPRRAWLLHRTAYHCMGNSGKLLVWNRPAQRRGGGGPRAPRGLGATSMCWLLDIQYKKFQRHQSDGETQNESSRVNRPPAC